MTVDEIFSKIVSHMAKGLLIHDQISIMFGFLNLEGYQKQHEYQYYSESIEYKNIQNYFLEHYYKIIQLEEIKKPDIIPPTWYKYSKMDVDISTKRSTIKTLMKKWIDWETDTKNELQKYYKELLDLGEICSDLKLSDFLKDVDNELVIAQTEYLNLEAIGYDMSEIVNRQEALYKKYTKQIKHLF